LLAAMEHLGKDNLSLGEARYRAKKAVVEREAAQYVDELSWDDLRTFLGTIALFLKAGPQRKEEGMRQFEDRDQARLSQAELGQRALDISNKLLKARDNNMNKLKRLSAQIAAARDKWEALTALARFYPLSGVPQQVVNDLVAELEQLRLKTFQELVAKALLFYEAQNKGWRPE